MGWVRKCGRSLTITAGYPATWGTETFEHSTRYMMAAVVVSLGAVPLLIMWTPFGPTGPVGQAISVLVIVCCAAMATMWLTRWPSRRQSVVFVVVSNAGIAATCLLCTAL